MNTKTATRDKRRTTMVPELLKSLKEAEARAKSGQTTGYDPKTFKDRLIGIYRRSRR